MFALPSELSQLPNGDRHLEMSGKVWKPKNLGAADNGNRDSRFRMRPKASGTYTYDAKPAPMKLAKFFVNCYATQHIGAGPIDVSTNQT